MPGGPWPWPWPWPRRRPEEAPPEAAHLAFEVVLALLLGVLLPVLFLCLRLLRHAALSAQQAEGDDDESRGRQWRRARAAFRAVSPQRIKASIRSVSSSQRLRASRLLARSTRKRLISKITSTGRKVNFQLKATRREMRKLSQEARTTLAQKSLSASSVAARTAFKGSATRAIRSAFGEHDNARLSSVLVDRQKSRRRRAGVAVEEPPPREPASTDPGPLPSDASPWDRLHVWLVAGDGLPYRPSGWPFDPYVVVSADVEEAFVAQEREGGGELCAPRAVSAYEFRVRAQYMDARRPVWDEKGLLCYRRGDAAQFRVLLGAQSRLTGGLWRDDALNPFGMLRMLWRALARVPPPPLWQASFDMPAPGGAWEMRRVPLSGGGVLTLKVRVTAWEDRPVLRLPAPITRPFGQSFDRPLRMVELSRTARCSEDFAAPRVEPPAAAAAAPAARGGAGGRACRRWRRACGMRDHVLELRDGERAVVSYCLASHGRRQRAAIGGQAEEAAAAAAHADADGGGDDGVADELGGREASQLADSALLWIPGRNDAFFHWHLLPLLWQSGFDLYVLSYRRVGECIRYGFVTNPMHVSHCSSGDFSEYHEELTAAIDFIQGEGDAARRYSRLLCYTHSTGAPILLHYLMAHGDGRFDGFVFNSPFLSWGWDVSPLTLRFIKHIPSLFMALGLWSPATELTRGAGPNDWALQFYSQYEFDPDSRPLYNVPVTVGFCRGINRVHRALRRVGRAGTPITLKPFLVLGSKGDDVLKGNDVLRAAHAIGPSRTLLELAYARHDVFASAEPEIVQAALAHLRAWLEGEGFSSRDPPPPSTANSFKES
ncbi:hypothetical protein AB1Y20_001643 [Prymnesium parvum]|uniref:C2 domain-containing protein n=1 Tax=Prymnesium parvum TaxID=97485 RepID=A0AB34K8C3_PRYPA